MTSKGSRRPTDSGVALHSIGPTGKPRFDGAVFGTVLVALIEAAKVYALDDACSTYEVLRVAGRFADNIRQGLEQRQSRMDVNDLAVALTILRRTDELLTTDRSDDDDLADIDRATAECLSAAAAKIEGMLEFVR